MKMIIAPILGLLSIIGVLTPLSLASPYRNSLQSGESLKAFEALSYRSFLFIMQPDCNLVLYHDSAAVWSTKTGGQDYGCYATLHNGGSLVVYSPKDVPLWQSSNRTGGGEYVMLLQKNGIVAIFGTAKWWVVWPRLDQVTLNITAPSLEGNEEATILSAMHEPTNVPDTPKNPKVGEFLPWEHNSQKSLKVGESLPWEHNYLSTWEFLQPGESLTWETHRCTMQTDCNFACWNATTFIWSTSTSGKGEKCYLKMQNNGKFNIYNKGNALVWQLPFLWSEGHYILIVQQKPILRVYGPKIWSTDSESLTRYSTAQPTNRKIVMVAGK